MADREKVIKGLECCMSEKGCHSPCPYNGECGDGGYYYSKAIEDAIALLKAQELVDAIKRGQDEQEDRERPPLPPIRHEDLCLVFLCPECGCDLRYYRCERCYRCGRRVKWDG